VFAEVKELHGCARNLDDFLSHLSPDAFSFLGKVSAEKLRLSEGEFVDSVTGAVVEVDRGEGNHNRCKGDGIIMHDTDLL
jgi:hypothetical protein